MRSFQRAAQTLRQILIEAYFSLVLGLPWFVLGVVLSTVAVFGYFARNFELDASAESLVLEDDEDLRYYRQMAERYQTKDFLFLIFKPSYPLFSETSLRQLDELQRAIEALPRVDSVFSILNAPLLQNPPTAAGQILENVKTLRHPEVDKALAEQELSESPLFRELILSSDSATASLVINFRRDTVHAELIQRREALKRDAGKKGTKETERALREIGAQIRAHNAVAATRLRVDIVTIRELMEKHRNGAQLHLGGVPMIADDMTRFIANDLMVFGLAVVAFVVLALSSIFRKPRWVLLSMLCCFVVSVLAMGLLGLADWQVTVISSNFLSLLLIITIAVTIHVIVRYREFRAHRPNMSQRQLVRSSIERIFRPCLYTVLTTMVAFSSLVVSGIRPVINFGWMMTAGLAISFVVVFLLFPAALMVLPRGELSPSATKASPITRFFADLTLSHGRAVVVAAVLLAVLSAWGISRLKVENSFINYFDESTEIYQGMTVIDREFGGTTPLDVMIDFPDESTVEALDPVFEDPFEDGDDDGDRYWFSNWRVEQIRAVHRYLEGLSEVGKVVSLVTMVDIAQSLNDDEPLDDLELRILYSLIPAEFRELVITPYVSVEHNQARVTLRIIDTDKDLRRDELLSRIREELGQHPQLEEARIRLSGIMVLYNNMLQSLFRSQIMTIGAVFVGIMLMFLVLFRSFKLALIGIAPNLLAAVCILGLIGGLGIPLDMMTITIAAITIGIAVDDTIHYIHRFKAEFPKDGNYRETLKRCHASIGKAVYYTSLTIIAGFSILALSNFIPTVYFGMLTSLAMFIALVGALTLLPQLLVAFEPFGRQRGDSTHPSGSPVRGAPVAETASEIDSPHDRSHR